ncbi:MAG: prolyl oligopeptidase family serine peptidase [Candidatus Latescibacteria bacterium]|nr:prolyl oligopeptidase family serine peptidase [Candidatus Latescibacterota bacterium]NIO00945.1 prolyl oligopeptidase family serine peptidase [Candidatus Latescibacterota bacterium]NIO27344.1 prolyl oligopeptidase family serine peptidase [Candidatus Latescibacterota bacterium]NIO54866.1 prolyl oligopeptidase family serine peptidase [Candidatus Latescibacterota bacterium]NIT00955.1 prolyl oligopeptidase family serine peptidase [Candidatus Latescibacterota bacterium]
MRPAGFIKNTLILAVTLAAAIFFLAASDALSSVVLSPEDVLSIKTCTSARISPDGKWIAYTVSVPREPGDEPGGSYSELHVVSVKTEESRPFITGKVSVSSPMWSPDGRTIAFLTRRGEKAKTQVWTIAVDGGEATQVTHSKTGVSTFRWHPSGKSIAYVATSPQSKREKELEKKGYGFVFHEENLKHRNLYHIDIQKDDKAEAKQLTKDITIWSFEFSPDGRTIAAGASEKNLVDYRYMFQKIHLIDVESGNVRQLTNNPGKLGNFAFSPDGSKIAYAAALLKEDHAVSQAFVIPVGGGAAENLTPEKFRGHVNWAGWKDNKTVLYRSGEEVWSVLTTVRTDRKKRKVILHANDSKGKGVIFGYPHYSRDFRHFAFIGSTPNIPGDVFYWREGKDIKRLTKLNPWLDERKLGKQEPIWYTARDGTKIQGILIYPVDFKKGEKHPLIVHVHGGPESHFYNRWMDRYFDPAQVLAGKGYFVFAPNYRPSTGYGLDFVLPTLGDAAGVEFDDVVDGIEHLVDEGLVDPERVGLGGGSYGGFAAAWFASYYTRYVKAVCMFVGISDLISKRGTTDIPYEELFVHSGKLLEEMWEFSLKRSPLYYAHQSRTAVLITGGTNDTRVHPSQSLEFYTRLKMNNHPAVRLVQYPGEGHGNRKQPARIDLLHRHIQWYDWYVKDKKPLDGPMPPLDISEQYSIDIEEEEVSSDAP